MAPSPIIFLLDMDGTIVGDATLQLCQADINKALGVPFKFNVTGLVRPHLESFLKTMKGESAEFFVYTAADPAWAACVIQAVEKDIGFKFNRPIFARPACIKTTNGYKKSISKVLPRVRTALKKRYALAELERRVVLVDNNKTIVPEHDSRFIMCPTYDAFSPRDVLAKLEHAAISEHHDKISATLHKYGFIPKHTYRNDAEFLWSYYAHLSKMIYEAFKHQRCKPDDIFFLELERHFRANN